MTGGPGTVGAAQAQPELRVLFNDTCPICRREVMGYQRLAQAQGVALTCDPLDRAADWGLTPDQAARELHVQVGDTHLAGVAAFRALWARLPGLRWLAVVTGLPGVRGVVAFGYARIAAPLLYATHRRRQRRTGAR